jgi:SPP1 gp7 family putative phage head morphogenesis protein
MSTPFHMDRVGMLYARTFEDLKGITAAMDANISRILSQGMVDGDGPRSLAGKIVDATGISRNRAMTLARTEIIRAHHSAMVQEYKNWAVEGVVVKAEWVDAGFNVCPKCSENNGKIFELSEIEGLIPLHPNCRCIALPTMPEKTVKEVAKVQETSDLTKDIFKNKDITNLLDQYTTYNNGTNGGDLWLKKIAEMQGMNQLPKVVTKDAFDNLDSFEIYRGVLNKKAITDTLSGEYYGGSGIFGNGYYFAAGVDKAGTKLAKDMALTYTDKNVDNLITAKLSKDIKIIKYADLQKEIETAKLFSQASTTILENKELVKKYKTFFYDPGRFAALKGYDGIEVIKSKGIKEIVILNRNKLIISE